MLVLLAPAAGGVTSRPVCVAFEEAAELEVSAGVVSMVLFPPSLVTSVPFVGPLVSMGPDPWTSDALVTRNPGGRVLLAGGLASPGAVLPALVVLAVPLRVPVPVKLPAPVKLPLAVWLPATVKLPPPASTINQACKAQGRVHTAPEA